jgi:hypothetical protein
MKAMTTRIDEATARRYLLGQLGAAEEEAFEDAYFRDPDVLEEVQAVEDDLLDDYVRGWLTQADRTALEAKAAVSPALRERLLCAGALRLAATRGRPTRLWVGLAAGLMLALLGLASLRKAPDKARTAEAPRSTPSPTVAVRVALSPVSLRGEGATPTVRLPADTAAVRFDLEVDPAAVPTGARVLEAAVASVDGDPAWSGGASADLDRVHPRWSASVDLPARHLGPGDYVLTLSAGGETVHRYFFRVEPRGGARHSP